MNRDAAITPVGGPPYETWRYTGPLGEAEFEASITTHGGDVVFRGGDPVTAISVSSLRWVGFRGDEAMSEAERSALVAELCRLYRAKAAPFDLVFPSGEVEDETGSVRPGFRSPLPRAEHSDGWKVVDLFLSPEYPDAATYPPTIAYSDALGEIEIPRKIETTDGTRHSVFDSAGMRRVGEREGDLLGAEDRRLIVERVRMVYDRWGLPYEMR